jgi:hypothetical protein
MKTTLDQKVEEQHLRYYSLSLMIFTHIVDLTGMPFRPRLMGLLWNGSDNQ